MSSELAAVVEKVYEDVVRPLSAAEQRYLAHLILANCPLATPVDWPSPQPGEALSDAELSVRLAIAFPGFKPATRHMRDIEITAVPLLPGRDLLEILRDVRDDRDYLP